MDPQYFGYAIAAVALAYLAVPLVSWLLTLLQASIRGMVRGDVLDRGGLEKTVPLLFVVPAHNEGKVIGRCVGSLLAQDYPPEMLSVVVVADNCDDETERIAKGLGARCLVRVDPDNPGKPQAIAWALGELSDPTQWEACVIIDADSEVAPDFAKCLRRPHRSGPKCYKHTMGYRILVAPRSPDSHASSVAQGMRWSTL